MTLILIELKSRVNFISFRISNSSNCNFGLTVSNYILGKNTDSFLHLKAENDLSKMSDVCLIIAKSHDSDANLFEIILFLLRLELCGARHCFFSRFNFSLEKFEILFAVES